MEESLMAVRDYYNSNVLREWERFERHPFEFRITTRMMDRYVKPGERILDIGGGPGRYSLYFAQKGCDVTLIDLSPENAAFAKSRADEGGLALTALSGDAREADRLVPGGFDHVFLMGPLYHLPRERDRVKAVNAALSLLKEGGNLYVSFIQLFAGAIYHMKFTPQLVLSEGEQAYLDAVLRDVSYGARTFTETYFIRPGDVLPFMERFALIKLHLFGQEGILSPCEPNLASQPAEVADRWVDIAYALCEREEYLSYAEHLMYIGRKA